MGTPNLYHVLGLGIDASPQELKTSYRQKSLEHHPDRGGSLHMMQLLNLAKEKLIDNPDIRRQYDEDREEAATAGNSDDEDWEAPPAARPALQGTGERASDRFRCKLEGFLVSVRSADFIMHDPRRCLSECAASLAPQVQQRADNLFSEVPAAELQRHSASQGTLETREELLRRVKGPQPLQEPSPEAVRRGPRLLEEVERTCADLSGDGLADLLLREPGDVVVALSQALRRSRARAEGSRQHTSLQAGSRIVEAYADVILDGRCAAAFVSAVQEAAVLCVHGGFVASAAARLYTAPVLQALLAQSVADQLDAGFATAELDLLFTASSPLRRCPELQHLRLSERNIRRHWSQNHLEAAFAYIDLAVAEPTFRTASVQCLVSAAVHLMTAIKSSAEAGRNSHCAVALTLLLEDLACEIFALSDDAPPPPLQQLALQACLSLCSSAHQCLDAITSESAIAASRTSPPEGTSTISLVLRSCLQQVVELSPLWPVCRLQFRSAMDQLLLESVFFREAQEKLLRNFLAQEGGIACARLRAKYFQFIGQWAGWLPDDFAAPRADLCRELLAGKMWTTEAVTLMMRRMTARGEDGWMPREVESAFQLLHASPPSPILHGLVRGMRLVQNMDSAAFGSQSITLGAEEILVTVTIPQAQSRTVDGGDVVFYEVVVEKGFLRWSVWRRYSEFRLLCSPSVVRSCCSRPGDFLLPYGFPGVSFWPLRREADLEARRRGLESWLQRAVRIDCKKSRSRIYNFLECNSHTSSHHVLSAADVQTLLQTGAHGILFSLDPPAPETALEDGIPLAMRYHPFHECRFAPQSLEGTTILDTLLQTDYILKMMTTGIEVASVDDYPFRPAWEDTGFLARLPPQLRDFLQEPLREVAGGATRGAAHRFWIEADAVPMHIDGDNVLVADPLMRVRKHLLQRAASGGLEDASAEDEDDDSSPEAEFARRFTAFYDEIAAFFPEFCRLKEIAKVCALGTSLQGFRHGLETKKAELTVERCLEISASILADLRSQVRAWPLNTNERVQEVLRDSLPAHLSIAQVPASVLANIRSRLREAEGSILTQLADVVGRQAHSSCSGEMVRRWLDGNGSDLKAWLSTQLRRHLINKVDNALRKLSDTGIKDIEITFGGYSERQCGWVPAAMSGESVRRVYGGVNLSNGYTMVGKSYMTGAGTNGTGGGGAGGTGGNGPRVIDKPAASLSSNSLNHIYCNNRHNHKLGGVDALQLQSVTRYSQNITHQSSVNGGVMREYSSQGITVRTWQPGNGSSRDGERIRTAFRPEGYPR